MLLNMLYKIIFILLSTCCIKFTYNNYVNKDNNIFYIIILWKVVYKTINIHGEIGLLKYIFG